MEIKRSVHIKDGLQYTMVIYGELLVPNPRQTYLNTRSYADMRAEYELLNCYKVTDEELMMLALSMPRHNTHVSLIAPIILMILLTTILFI